MELQRPQTPSPGGTPAPSSFNAEGTLRSPTRQWSPDTNHSLLTDRSKVQFDGESPPPRDRTGSRFSREGSRISRQASGSRGSFHDNYEGLTHLQGTSINNLTFIGDASPKTSAAIFNLANTIMGASLTGLPYVVSASGIVPYLMFMSLSVYVGYKTICFLVDALPYVGGKKDFQVVGVTAMGRSGAVLTAVATWLSCYGALIAYFVLTGIQGPFLCRLLGFDPEPWVVQVAVAICVITPLCMLRDISALAPTSFVAIMVFVLIACTAVFNYLADDDFYRSEEARAIGIKPDTTGIEWFPATFGWKEMAQFPTILMGFNCQYAFLPIVENFSSERPAEMKKVGLCGLLVPYFTNIALGVCAYLTYRGHTEDMILLNFRHCHEACDIRGKDYVDCPTDHLEKSCIDGNAFISALNGLFLFAVLMGYPCVHFACRKAQIAITFGLDSSFRWRVHCGMGLFNILATLGIALAVGDEVSTVFRWTGAVASPLLSFVLPAAFYFQILGNTGVPFLSKLRLGVFMVLLYGFATIIFGVLCNLLAP